MAERVLASGTGVPTGYPGQATQHFPGGCTAGSLDLRHPLLWGIFSAEPELTQHAILNGNCDALDRLVEAYVGRFLDRAANRREGLGNRDDVRYLLEVVAAGTNANEEYGYSEGWHRPASQAVVSGNWSQNASTRKRRPRNDRGCSKAWRWRHGFVWDFLIALVSHDGER